MAELTLEKAREVYKTSDSLNVLILTKFSKEELKLHKVSQGEFNDALLEIMKTCTKTVFIDENSHVSDHPTNWMIYKNSDDQLLFDIQFTGNFKHFFVSDAVWNFLADKYSLDYYDVERLMKYDMNCIFGLFDVQPKRIGLDYA